MRRIVGTFRPDAVIGVGGYSSFPVLRYAQAKGIATFIHESNSFAGKSNILLGKKAKKIFVASDGMEKFFPADRIQVTGNPVRRNIVDMSQKVGREEAIRSFGLDPARQTVFSTGGSLGAKGDQRSGGRGVGRVRNGMDCAVDPGTRVSPSRQRQRPFARTGRVAGRQISSRKWSTPMPPRMW